MKEKIERILNSEVIIISILENLEELFELIPELKDMVNFEHKHPYHILDVWKHTLLALSLSPNDFEVRLSLLLHDIGKPHCYTEGEVRHFNGHEKVSSEMTELILKRLGFDERSINKISYLVLMHDTPITESEIKEDKNLAYKRFVIAYCDTYAHNPEKIEKRENLLRKLYYKF